jgi:hypothetical protein
VQQPASYRPLQAVTAVTVWQPNVTFQRKMAVGINSALHFLIACSMGVSGSMSHPAHGVPECFCTKLVFSLLRRGQTCDVSCSENVAYLGCARGKGQFMQKGNRDEYQQAQWGVFKLQVTWVSADVCERHGDSETGLQHRAD